MSVGALVRKIREDHGDSLMDAQKRTGVSKSTFQRIESGYNVRGLVEYLQKIASGYGIPETVLLDSQTPRGKFEGFLRRMSLSERWQMAAAPMSVRVGFALDFLQANLGPQFSVGAIAFSAKRPQDEITRILRRWRVNSPDTGTLVELSTALKDVYGMSLTWLQTGVLEDEAGSYQHEQAADGYFALKAAKARRPSW